MSDGVPLTVKANYPVPGEPDMDWTEPFLERGTKLHLSGVMQGEVQVTRAYVKDEVLYVEGQTEIGGHNLQPPSIEA